MKVKVSYSVSYIAEVELEDLQDLFARNLIDRIDIPQGGNNNSRYIEDTFEPLKVKNTEGKWKNIEDLEFLS